MITKKGTDVMNPKLPMKGTQDPLSLKYINHSNIYDTR